MFKLFFLGIICHLIFIEISNAQFKYPAARKEIFDTVIYGKKISDEYFWMSRKKKCRRSKKIKQAAKQFSTNYSRQHSGNGDDKERLGAGI